jgi:hypothetical protein
MNQANPMFQNVLFSSALLKTPEDGDILVDFSKNRINEDVFALLVDLVLDHGKA